MKPPDSTVLSRKALIAEDDARVRKLCRTILEEEGYIAVNPGKDARARLVSATGSGRRALKRAIPLWKKAQAHMVKGLGDRRFESLLGDLADTVKLSRVG